MEREIGACGNLWISFRGGVSGHVLSCAGVGEPPVCPAVVCEEEWEEKKAEVHAEGERGYKMYFRQKLGTTFSCHWLHCFMVVVTGLANMRGSSLLQSLVP